MTGYLTIHFSGMLLGDVKLSVTATGVDVANFRVLVTRIDRDGDKHDEVMRIAAFGDHAAKVKHLIHGNTVHGWGQQRTSKAGTETVVDRLETP